LVGLEKREEGKRVSFGSVRGGGTTNKAFSLREEKPLPSRPGKSGKSLLLHPEGKRKKDSSMEERKNLAVAGGKREKKKGGMEKSR